MKQPVTPERDSQNDRGDVTVVTTRRELETAFDDLSRGDTIHITDENAPYRTTEWLDVDVDGVTIIGPGVRTLIEPADGAAVGGLRIGHHDRCEEIDVRGVGYRGSPPGRPKTAGRLHGVAVRNATNVTIQRNHIRRTYPVEHGNGGSGISVTEKCSNIRVFNNQIHQFGDRGVQLGGRRHMVFGNVITNGLDRAIACDLWPRKTENHTARSVSIFGNLLGNSVQGSLVGIARNSASSSRDGYVCIFGNVGFGSHKSFCHVRGPQSLRNISIQNNVSLQRTDGLATNETTKFSGVAVDVAEVRNLAINSNQLYSYSGDGVRVVGDATDLAIQHNTVAEPELAGIRFEGGSGGLIDGNFVTAAGTAGIRLRDVTNTVVRGNYVRGAGSAGVIVGGSSSATGNEVADNYVTENNRASSEAFPGILVRDDGVRVRGNGVRQNRGPAIAEPDTVSENVYEGNWADGDRPWRFSSPASRVRNNAPPTGVYRGLSPGSDGSEVRIAFDRPYARVPSLAFGRTAGGIRDVSYATDENGNYAGVTITVERQGGTVDVFVNGS